MRTYHCYWLQDNALKLYMKIIAKVCRIQIYKQKILGTTVKSYCMIYTSVSAIVTTQAFILTPPFCFALL